MLLEVKNLGIAYGDKPPIVQGVTFNLDEGEILAIVGESGSGKTTVIRAIQHVLPGGGHIAEGQVILEGEDTQKQTPEMHRALCGTDVSMIFQDSGAMMNPIRTIGTEFREFLAVHGIKDDKEAHDLMISMIEMVRLPNPEHILKCYPYELSGGMRQRVMIAMALACEPDILIADEPTTALDVTIQAQILELMQSLQKKLGMAIIMVTHDLGVIAEMCDEIVVMYGGRFCERGTADEIFYNPRHEYTRGLLRSIPNITNMKERLVPISGTPINMLNMPKGCAFCARCDKAMKICLEQVPEERIINESHRASCWINTRDNIGTVEEAE